MSRLDSLMQHPQANSDSATYRRSDRSSPRPESDDGMPYNHRRTSVKADEMAPGPPSYSADDDDGESPEALPELTPRIPSGRPSQLIALSRNSPTMPLHLAHLLPVVLVQHRHQVAWDQQRPL
ncbi:hypothetical protein F5888DRAFT_1808462 [Russula emetica]|nr:hypothetical protein F5888DRAFT_1808462 [Russula emetica]